MEDIDIRPIRPGDAQALAAFYNGLAEASKRTFHPLGDTTTVEACDTVIAENAPGAGKKYDAVALADGRIVGWSFLWSLQSGSPTFGLGVADGCQGQRLGSRLMDHILGEAARRGISKISLTVVQDNDRARSMYERRGFVRQEAFVGEDGLSYYYMTAEFPSYN
ncbi:MAG: GNAT family N-acetyltransferase [Candidatus Hydrogenedentes bacterium]|nr:GNAT family N-acetyltransferase [Candidatus Hydrogenedentota bacterium]